MDAQTDAIEIYARKQDIAIVGWFEESASAAKKGRPEFTRMLKLLRAGKADGLLIHKIDRSARNLSDWAALGELIDSGKHVHFVHESLNLEERAGRLSADLQAVVSADYIRNLSQEALKGLRHRLQQGLWPFAAPIGYINNGKGGKLKTVDAEKAPIVRQAFDLYDSGEHSLRTLGTELQARGLTNSAGGAITISGVSKMLRNPFYIGILLLRTTGEHFAGKHEPIVPRALFQRVQERLAGRCPVRLRKHSHVFRQLFRCQLCGRCLIGEVQKGHVYYRCHTTGCRGGCFKEETLHLAISKALNSISLDASESSSLRRAIEGLHQEALTEAANQQRTLRARLANSELRSAKLLNTYLDSLIDRTTFAVGSAKLSQEQAEIKLAIESGTPDWTRIRQLVTVTLELASSPEQSYMLATDAEKRQLVKKACSNLRANHKDALVEPHEALLLLAGDRRVSECDPNCVTSRTRDKALRLVQWATRQVLAESPGAVAT